MTKYSKLSDAEKMLYRSIKKSNDKLIREYSKKHNISESKLKENIDYCLDKERHTEEQAHKKYKRDSR